MKASKRFATVLAIVVLIVISGIFLFLSRTEKTILSEAVDEKETVRLAVANGFITAPVLLALHLGHFSEAGLEVVVTGNFSSGRESLESMLAGKADISTPATTPIVFNSFTRQDYSIFATYTTTYEGIKIVARTDRGINSADDLKHKTIGIVPGTISQILLDSFLSYNKILLNEVDVLNFKGHELPKAIRIGEVDAISVWEPHATTALLELAGNGIKIPTSQVYRIAINLAVMNDFAQKHPAVLAKMVRALIKTTDYMRNNNEEAQEVLSEILKMDKKLIANEWRDIVLSVSLDQLLLITMENEAKWFIEHRFPGTKQIPNYLNYIHYQALEKVDPDSITIIRKAK